MTSRKFPFYPFPGDKVSVTLYSEILLKYQQHTRCNVDICYLELLRHEDALEGDLVPRPGHAEQPGDPLQEQHANLQQHNHHNLSEQCRMQWW